MLTLTLTARGKSLRRGTGFDAPRVAGLQRSGDDLQANFARFWAAYPHKVGKDAALRAFRTLRPDNDLTDAMIAAVETHRASAQWRKDGGQFIPHPRTWLHQGRWKDEPATVPTPSSAGATTSAMARASARVLKRHGAAS